jgi:flagellar FliL protein
MASAAAATAVITAGGADAPAPTAAPAPRSKKKLIIIAVPAVLAAIGAGLWFGGILPPLLGMGKPKAAMADKLSAEQAAEAAATAIKPPTFFEVPDIVANLNSGKRPTYVKLKARLELGKSADIAVVQAAMPRLLDMFQTYLREMRPEELRGSEGTWRLREELIARANIAVRPARVADVLFVEMLIQ